MDVRGTAACSACDDIILFRVAVLLCGVLLWLGFESYWLFIAWVYVAYCNFSAGL